MSNLINTLPVWSGDCGEQSLFIESLKQQLQAALTVAESQQATPVYLSQTTEPTQGQWEAAYTAQTGRALPITPSTQLIWWNSADNRLGGMYGTTPLFSTVASRVPALARNTILFQQSKSPAGTTINSSTPIGLNVFSESITMTINQPFNLEMIHSVYLTVTTAGTIGGDFLINGVKAGSAYYGVQSNRGLYESTFTQLYNTRLFLEAMPPGTYTIQNIFGYTATPVTPPAATRQGISQFMVRAYGI